MTTSTKLLALAVLTFVILQVAVILFYQYRNTPRSNNKKRAEVIEEAYKK